MGKRSLLFMCLIVMVTALPKPEQRHKRDVTETMKHAWDEVVKTADDAGDAIVNVFKPTEKGVLDKMADGLKGITE